MNSVTHIDIEPRVGCIANAMNVIGTKWTALILRDLASSPRRYSELQKSIDINPRTLSQRLDFLVEQAIVEQIDTAECCHKSYQLTMKGRGLIPILEKMASWGDRYNDTSLA